MKDHKINTGTHLIDNTIMIYNETTREVHIDKQERIKPNKWEIKSWDFWERENRRPARGRNQWSKTPTVRRNHSTKGVS